MTTTPYRCSAASSFSSRATKPHAGARASSWRPVPPARLSLNIGRVSEYGAVSVEVLDERLNPLPGYSRENCDLLAEIGYNQLISWGERDAIAHKAGRIRIRIDFAGLRPEDIHLYAIYLTEAS